MLNLTMKFVQNLLRIYSKYYKRKLNKPMFVEKRNFQTYYVGPPRKIAVDLCYKFIGNKNVIGTGMKPPVLLLHGLLSSKNNWTNVGKTLNVKTKRNIMAVDLRNHGQSPHVDSHDYTDLTLDVVKLLKKLEIEKAALLGHGMGGRSAMVTALKKPKIVDRLIVVDIAPTAKAIPNTEYLLRVLDAMNSVSFKGVNDITEALSVAEKKLESISEDDNTLNTLLMNLGQKPDNTFTWVCNVNALKNYLPSISTFPKDVEDCVYTGPTLFILGEKSEFVLPHDMTAIKRYFPLNKVEYVPNAGHNVHADDPNKFIELVSEFLK